MTAFVEPPVTPEEVERLWLINRINELCLNHIITGLTPLRAALVLDTLTDMRVDVEQAALQLGSTAVDTIAERFAEVEELLRIHPTP